MAMTNDDYRHFACIVAGEFPDDLMKKYDSNKEVEQYVVYKFEDAAKIRQNYITVYESILKYNNLSAEEREEYVDALNETKNVSDEDFFYDISMGYDLDPDTGDAVSTKNQDGRWSYYTRGKIFSKPFILKDGTTSFSAKKKDIDWDKNHLFNYDMYCSVWEMVIDGRPPMNDDETRWYENMKSFTTYLKKFETKENYAMSCSAFWGYAFLSEDTGWEELEDNENQFEWMKGFYDKYIAELPDDTLLTILECTK